MTVLRDISLAVIGLVLILGICISLPEFIIEGPQAKAWMAFAQHECPNDPIFVPVDVEPSQCAKDALDKFFSQN